MTPCTFPDCGRDARARGLCIGHDAQRRRGVALRPLLKKHGQHGSAPLVRLPGLRVPAAHAEWLRSLGPSPARAAVDLIRRAYEAREEER